MDHFQRDAGERLHAEGVALDDVAARFGTPTYVYSRATLTRHVRVLREGMGELPHHICYAVKANANLAVLQVLEELGVGFDAVSVGELARTAAIGADPQRVIFSGVGKRDDEIAAALRAGVLYICVESTEELEAIGHIAAELGVRAPVSVRVNPDVDAKTHPSISTGLKENKFGVPMTEAEGLYQRARELEAVDPIGLTCHIGSQITELSPFEDAARRLAGLATRLRERGVALRYLGVGGGLGVPYRDETPPPPGEYGAALAEILGGRDFTIVLEPGRVIVGNAGVLLSRVVRTKKGADRDFVILDAGMNDLMRPALYDAYHEIVTVAPPREGERVVDVVGPVCETTDTFARHKALPPLETGDLVAFRTAGAYGFVMSGTYNGRPRPAEVLVDGDAAHGVREREPLEELWRGERGLDGALFDAALPGAMAPALRGGSK